MHVGIFIQAFIDVSGDPFSIGHAVLPAETLPKMKPLVSMGKMAC